MFRGGVEAWCNLQGQYTTIVADYTGTFEYNSSSTIDFTICSLGIFGTNYVRTDPLELDDLSVETG